MLCLVTRRQSWAQFCTLTSVWCFLSMCLSLMFGKILFIRHDSCGFWIPGFMNHECKNIIKLNESRSFQLVRLLGWPFPEKPSFPVSLCCNKHLCPYTNTYSTHHYQLFIPKLQSRATWRGYMGLSCCQWMPITIQPCSTSMHTKGHGCKKYAQGRCYCMQIPCPLFT